MPTVLIVDDEAATVFGLKMLLEEEGVSALTAESGPEAEALLAAQHVDVLLTDVRLGGTRDVSGLALLQFVHDGGLPTRTIVMTGYGAPSVLQRAFDLGAAYYFEKPVDLALLGAALTRLGVPCDLTERR